ncbi:MAG: HD domain-containing protein [Treponema sp.]|nr:HD domain-containing protein [Treponema sp.]
MEYILIMDRLEKIRECIDKIYQDPVSVRQNKYISNDYNHIYGVSFNCVLFALKRGLDPELAAVAGMLHDVYRLRTGVDNFHSVSGAEMSRIILRNPDIFTDAEKQIILTAVFHHSDKANVHDEYSELLKDADLFTSFMKTGASKLHITHLPRIKKMAAELGIDLDFDRIEINNKTAEKKSIDKRSLLADIAEKLAAMPITGSRDDSVYMNLIRYWPEESAFDELKNGWCAAFVYHCCQTAGFIFPIKWTPGKLRFACVAAWNAWAREKKFFIKDGPGIIPQRGDIILYKNIIPLDNKKADQRNEPVDHIGIVLGSSEDEFTVAEGNVNNQNVSGILTRQLHYNIEGFIRIDNEMEYDGQKCADIRF